MLSFSYQGSSVSGVAYQTDSRSQQSAALPCAAGEVYDGNDLVQCLGSVPLAGYGFGRLGGGVGTGKTGPVCPAWGDGVCSGSFGNGKRRAAADRAAAFRSGNAPGG